MKNLAMLKLAALLCGAFLFTGLAAGPARAQDDAGAPAAGNNDQGGGDNVDDNGAPVLAAPSGLVQLDTAGLPRLAATVGRAGTRAVSVGVTRADLEGDPAALTALRQWVFAGGTVFLHTDAADLFGYSTVPAREGSNREAGQLYGRARAALGLGAHLLLTADGEDIKPLAAGSDPTRLPGVNVVFYELQDGDSLVASHPCATPLLQVTDLTENGGTPLFAAALAPYGAGWAAFTPDTIDSRRADGALFLRNLLRILPDAHGRRQLVGIPAAAIESATGETPDPAALLAALGRAVATGRVYSPALPPIGAPAPAVPGPRAAAGVVGAAQDLPAGPAEGPQPDLTAGATRVLLTRAEALSLQSELRTGTTATRTAALQILRAQLEWQRGQIADAGRWLDDAEQSVPGSAEVAYWRGCLDAAVGSNVGRSSPQRAQAMHNAAEQWTLAGTSTPLFPVVPDPAGTYANGTPGDAAGDNGAAANPGTAAPADAGAPPVAGVSSAAIAQLVTAGTRAATVFAAEPPLVQTIGNGNAAITLHYFDGDTSLRLIVPALTALSDAGAFGWRCDREEVVLFSDQDSYNAYRQAAGLTGQFAPLPAGSIGDVTGQRIVMVAIPAFPTLTTAANGKILFMPGNPAGANVLARLHCYALLNALGEDGREPPTWMQLGLEMLLSAAIDTTSPDGNIMAAMAPPTDGLSGYAHAGGLLTPAQFRAEQEGGAEASGLAQNQSIAMMYYFYGQFGAGSVVETLQRIAARESTSDAFQATTQGDEPGFFVSWRNSAFGPQTFPNAG